jgi:ABC-2 type transport system permease protein
MFLLQLIIQVMAFVRKELFGALRQPRLILSLVLGPFLILALFGLGYQGSSRYKTILVVPNQPGISTNVQDYNDVVRQTFQLTEVSKNEQDAVNKLNQGQVDVVIVVPANSLDEIYNGRNAKFPVYYRNLNPLQTNYIEYSTYVYASEFDKVILRQALTAAKPQTNQLQETTKQLNTSTDALDQAMQNNNLIEAKLQVQRMRTVVQVARAGVASLILPGNGTGDSAQQKLLGGEITNAIFKSGVGQMQADLDNIDNKLNALDDGFNRGDVNSPQQRANLASIRQSNASLSDKANKIAAIPPAVLVEPVLSAAKNLVTTNVSYINFYGPAVVILLLQHIAITLASLSNVRDRLIGAIEIFRVSPISPSQILTGKFISLSILLLLLAGALIALITQALGVPFVNFGINWLTAVAVLAVTIYASIGLGFLVGALSRTESQAVQLSMILLLGSIFFSGFVVPLTQFAGYVQYVGYVLPMTWGSTALQQVMLDNRPLDPFYLLMPLAIGTVYMALGLFLYRRQYSIA